jgi:hypothetical protein
MWRPIRIFRPNQESDDKQSRSTRDVLAESLRILKRSPQPDNFLGRKTQEPFPKEEPAD